MHWWAAYFARNRPQAWSETMQMATFPLCFRPSATADLVRVGAAFDGGYGVPERVLRASKGLLSFGLGDDCAFEIEFARAGCPVVCFDPVVNVRFWAARTASSFAKAILQLEPRRFGYVKRWLDYRRLFANGRHRHLRQPIGYGVGGSVSYPEAVRIAGFQGRYFLKIDVEGSEYRVLDDIVAGAEGMTGIVIELHDIDLHADRIARFLSAISERMVLVHFHPNTATQFGPNETSLMVELSFLNRSLLAPREQLMHRELPIAGVDLPNSVYGKQMPVAFR
jgi:hypothetical protein